MIGLAVSTLAINFHKLMTARAPVRWDWLSPLLALLMLFVTVSYWWASYSWHTGAKTLSIAAFLPDPDRALVLEVLDDTGHADFALREVRAATEADRRLAGRLALWGRRLVGEAITRSQAVIAEHDGLAELIITGTGDLAGVGRLIDRITAAHTERMKTLGLNP